MRDEVGAEFLKGPEPLANSRDLWAVRCRAKAPLDVTAMADAYRHVPVASKLFDVQAAAVYDESAGEPEVQHLWRMLFGLAGAVACFNRWPPLAVASARKMLMYAWHIPRCQQHLDRG